MGMWVTEAREKKAKQMETVAEQSKRPSDQSV